MPVLVRNTEAGPTCFSDLDKKIAIEWQGKDDPNGEDIQHVPDVIVTENVNFLKMLQRGVFEIVEASPETQEAIARQAAAWRERRGASEQSTADAIDRQAENDFVSVPCIGPSPRGVGECGEPVPVREKARDAKPPLCSTHQNLASEYVHSEGEFDNQLGHGKRKWERIPVGTREWQ